MLDELLQTDSYNYDFLCVTIIFLHLLLLLLSLITLSPICDISSIHVLESLVHTARRQPAAVILHEMTWDARRMRTPTFIRILGFPNSYRTLLPSLSPTKHAQSTDSLPQPSNLSHPHHHVHVTHTSHHPHSPSNCPHHSLLQTSKTFPER